MAENETNTVCTYKIIRAPEYQCARTGTELRNELWYTIPYRLHRNGTRNMFISLRCTGILVRTPGNEYTLRRAKGKGNEKRTKETKRTWSQNKPALRAQTDASRGDKVAVGWYDQSCDMSSWWANRRTTEEDHTEDKKRADRRAICI